MSWPSFCHFIFLSLVACFQPAVLQTISPSEPVSVPVGQNATFSCTGVDLFFIEFILESANESNRFAVEDDGPTQLPERNVFSDTTPEGIFVLHVLSSSENNNTKVTCRDIDGPSSATVPIVAIGPPLPPGVILSSLNATSISLTWEMPFIFPGYNITSYTITKVDILGNTSEFTTTDLSFTYSSQGDGPESCTVTFVVLAESDDLGPSEPASVTTELFIAPGQFYEVGHEVRFSMPGNPEVIITFQPPEVCQDQMVTLTLEATDEESGMDVTPSDIMTQTYSGQPQMHSFSLDSDLEYNTFYSVVLTAEAPGVGMSSAELTFNFVYTCDTDNGGCAQVCNDTASDDEDPPLCFCRTGFELATDGFSCDDINECDMDNGGCDVGMTCTNTEGSFECGSGMKLATSLIIVLCLALCVHFVLY